jgi:hypothetical protein
MVSFERFFGLRELRQARISMNATDTMRTHQKAKILEIPDAPVSHSGLRCVYLACGKFLKQRGKWAVP